MKYSALITKQSGLCINALATPDDGVAFPDNPLTEAVTISKAQFFGGVIGRVFSKGDFSDVRLDPAVINSDEIPDAEAALVIAEAERLARESAQPTVVPA